MKQLLKEAMDALRKKGVDYADARRVRTTTELLVMKNGEVETGSVTESEGFGIRVLNGGAWGFSSSSDVSSKAVAEVAEQALAIARASGRVGDSRVILDGQEAVVDVYKNKVAENPFDVPLEEKLNILARSCEGMSKAPEVRFATASMMSFRNDKLFVSTEGSDIEQTIIETGGGIAATAMEGGERQTRSYPASFRGDYATSGFEFTRSLDLPGHAEKTGREAAELLRADECPSRNTTLIIGGTQLALQVHESCGHPIELDRVFGTEASYAGTSFLGVDKLGEFRYGSDIVNIVADATAPGGLGSFGYDDEGVPASRTDIVREGIFVGLPDESRDRAEDRPSQQRDDAGGRLEPHPAGPHDQHQPAARQGHARGDDRRHRGRHLRRLQQELEHRPAASELPVRMRDRVGDQERAASPAC